MAQHLSGRTKTHHTPAVVTSAASDPCGHKTVNHCNNRRYRNTRYQDGQEGLEFLSSVTICSTIGNTTQLIHRIKLHLAPLKCNYSLVS